MPAIAFAMNILSELPALIGAGIDVVDLITKGNDALKKMQVENRAPSDEEWAELNQMIEDLRAQRPDVTGE